MEVFERYKYDTPNISGRMDNLRAAILRPQLIDLDKDCAAWTERYHRLETGLQNTPGLTLISRPEAETFVGSSFQFLLLDWSAGAVEEVVARCLARGVELKWFGAAEPAAFTSRYDSWRYAAVIAQNGSHFAGYFGHSRAFNVFLGGMRCDRADHSQ
jgi:dTDP-4-amino-4,6-dideoxygalactose transaminase